MRKEISPERGVVTRIGALTLAVGLTLGTSVHAQEQQQAEQDQAPEETEEVVVTGYRAALRSALETKRESGVMVDAINSDDIADFPDANLAESLQRIPGISIDRDQGEGRQITVRGLGPDFTRVRINGLEALATGGNNEAGTNPNRSRSFDFNTFASELFSSLKVQKTSSAETDEGSLGATIDLTTGRPFDFKSFQVGFSAEDSYYENGETHNPKFAGLVSWHNDTFGALLSAAYSERETEVDQYRRQPGVADFLYRQSAFASGTGTAAPQENPQRGGFSAPVGTVLTGYTNAAAIAAMTGSDPTAYANLYPGAPYNTPGRFDDSLVKIPTLAAVEQADTAYTRVGVTNSYQWKPDDSTTVNLDLLYSRYNYSNVISQISTVGLNRDNTNAAFATATGPLTAGNQTARRNLYPNPCNAPTNATQPPQDCGEIFYGGALVPGFQFSRNPRNLDPFEYFNNPLSVGYNPASPQNGTGLVFRDALIGRQGVDVLASNVTNGVADYLELRNVDLRSAADASFYVTTFKQASLNVEQEVSDSFHASFTYGASESLNEVDGQLVEFNSMDSPGTYVFDERAHGSMPTIDYGVNVADPNIWGIVKSFSAMRHFVRTVENKYDGGHLDMKWDMNDKLSLAFGGSMKSFTFDTQLRERNTDTINPTEKEAFVSTASLGRVIDFGQGLDVPAGTLTQFWAPDLEAFRNTFGFDCSCVNQYGDFRTIRRNAGREDFSVEEDSSGLYLQLNYDLELFGRRLFGNIGAREAWTDLTATGNANQNGGTSVTANNTYSDFLPSFNLAYSVMDDLLIRLGAAKVMSRPQLSNLSPTMTAITVPTTPTGNASLTVGNPYLKPFRADSYDFSVEWYFSEGALLSAAYFMKKIDSYPQTVAFSAPLSTFLGPEAITDLLAGYTNQVQRDYITNDGDFLGRQFRDAPGGELKGYEISYQQDFTFLPGFLKNFGAQINYTHIETELLYIIDPGSGPQTNPALFVPQTFATGPWLGASPESLNATLYYEVPSFSARVSLAKRKPYFTTFPIAAGSCQPGIVPPVPASPATSPSTTQGALGSYCNGPLVNDFVGSEGTENIDASIRWNVTDNLAISLEGLNLTNQTTDRFAYVDSPVVSQYGSTGRQFVLGARFKY
jgi:iron complex outermembrane recepter protein